MVFKASCGLRNLQWVSGAAMILSVLAAGTLQAQSNARLVADVNPTGSGLIDDYLFQSYARPCAMNGVLYFVAYTDTTGFEFWAVDGPQTGSGSGDSSGSDDSGCSTGEGGRSLLMLLGILATLGVAGRQLVHRRSA